VEFFYEDFVDVHFVGWWRIVMFCVSMNFQIFGNSFGSSRGIVVVLCGWCVGGVCL